MIAEEGGLEAVWRRHQVLADAVRAAVTAWSTPGGIELNITSPPHRSNAVSANKLEIILAGRFTCRRLDRRNRLRQRTKRGDKPFPGAAVDSLYLGG